jgi:hypothetical protein
VCVPAATCHGAALTSGVLEARGAQLLRACHAARRNTTQRSHAHDAANEPPSAAGAGHVAHSGWRGLGQHLHGVGRLQCVQLAAHALEFALFGGVQALEALHLGLTECITRRAESRNSVRLKAGCYLCLRELELQRRRSVHGLVPSCLLQHAQRCPDPDRKNTDSASSKP